MSLETLQDILDYAMDIGNDNGFSFPLRYFETRHLLPDWPTVLKDFQFRKIVRLFLRCSLKITRRGIC